MALGEVAGLAGAGGAASSMMPWGMAISGGLGLVNSILGANASEDAARAQAEAQERALAFAQQKYQDAQTNLSPYMQTGQAANQRLGDLVAGMQQPGFDYQQKPFSFDEFSDPGAQYQMQQAIQAINASSLAKGGLGGGALKALNTEVQNMGNTAFQGSFNRYMDTSKMLNDQAQQKYARNTGWQNNVLDRNAGLATAGQNAAAGLGGLGQQTAQLGSGLISDAGNARAQGALGRAGSWIGGLGQMGEGLSSGLGFLSGGGGLGGQLGDFWNSSAGVA